MTGRDADDAAILELAGTSATGVGLLMSEANAEGPLGFGIDGGFGIRGLPSDGIGSDGGGFGRLALGPEGCASVDTEGSGSALPGSENALIAGFTETY